MIRIVVLAAIALMGAAPCASYAQLKRSLLPGDPLAEQVVGSDRSADSFALWQQAGSGAEKKSVGTAILYSVLLPGMGELYAGDYSAGKYFTIAEGALWIALGSVDWYANWLQDDAHQFAAAHAQASIGGKDDRYFIDIGNFPNIYDYNAQALRDRSTNTLYPETPANYWNWDSPTNQGSYRDKRVSSEQMFNNTRFVIAAIAVNHVISALNAARLTAAYNKRADEAQLFDLHAEILGGLAHPDGILLTFSKTF